VIGGALPVVKGPGNGGTGGRGTVSAGAASRLARDGCSPGLGMLEAIGTFGKPGKKLVAFGSRQVSMSLSSPTVILFIYYTYY